MMDTEMSYHLYSPDFHNMRSLGIMEQLVPIADNIQLHITDYNKRLQARQKVLRLRWAHLRTSLLVLTAIR